MNDSAEKSGRNHALGELRRLLHTSAIDRRTFVRRAAALGVAAPAISWMLRAYGASASPAHGPARISARRQDNPITVTVGGEPIQVTEEDTTNAPRGGTLRFARAEDSKNLDPVTNDGNVNIWIFMNVYDQLLRVTRDGINLEPALAESWEISDDLKTYTFHLRQGVKFSDGAPLKASDVVYSLTRAANDPAQTWTFTLTALQRDASGQVQGISAPDDNTVVIELAQAWTPFLSDLAMFNCSIISEAFAKGQEDRLVRELMGTGPFMLAEWKLDEYILLAKNPNYWEEGLPLLDQVQIFKVPDDNNRILQIQAGEVDAITNVPASRVPELKQDGSFQVYEFPSTHTQYITFNTRNAPLDDVHARLALSYATDRQALIEIVLFGAGIEATSFMPKGALYWNSELQPIPYDVEKAKAELAQTATPDGFPLAMSYLGGDVEGEQLGTALIDMWSKIGVEVSLVPIESSVFFDVYTARDFEAIQLYWTNDIIDPDELVAYAILPESSEQFGTGWSNQEAMDLARQGAAELDPEKRQAIYFRIQEIYAAESPMLFLYHKPYVEVMSPRVHNFGHPPTGQWVWKKTWIDPA